MTDNILTKEKAADCIQATYRVTDTTKPARLLKKVEGITEMWIEKVADTRAVSVPVQIEPCREYTFAETGNYKMYFKFEGTKIADNMFFNCTSLTSIVIPEGVESIGYNAFEACDALKEVTLPSTLTEIRDWAFWWCTSLTSITIPEGVTSIGWSAFEGCKSLTSIVIPEGVTEIQYATFRSCTALKSVTLPEGVTKIWDRAFSGCTSLTPTKTRNE